MISSLYEVAAAVPGYCTSGHGVLTPTEWKTCWDLGWSQPTTGAAHAGYAAGHGGAPVLLILVVVVLVLAGMVRAGRNHRAAAQGS